MSELPEAVRAIAALFIGGFIFAVLGPSLTSSMSSEPMLNFQFFGLLYILAAIVLAAVVVYGAVRSVL